MAPQKARSLMYRTWELLEAAEEHPNSIANRIGVTPEWIRLFKKHRVRNPSVNTIQRLYEYLSGEPLFKD